MPSQTPRHGVGAIGAGHLAHLALPVAGCHHVKHGLLFFGSAHRPCLSAGLVLEGPSETQLTSTMPRWSRDSLKLPAPAALAGPVSHLATAKSRAICGWSNKKRWGFARSLRKWTSALRSAVDGNNKGEPVSCRKEDARISDRAYRCERLGGGRMAPRSIWSRVIEGMVSALWCEMVYT